MARRGRPGRSLSETHTLGRRPSAGLSAVVTERARTRRSAGIPDAESHPWHSLGVERRKPGPKPKGDRSQITVRVPSAHRELYEHAARAAGWGLSDYLMLVLARAHFLPEPPVPRRMTEVQEELPVLADQ